MRAGFGRPLPGAFAGDGSGRDGEGAPDLLSLLWHPSDAVARPLVGNRAIERQTRPPCDPAALPFAPLVRAPAHPRVTSPGCLPGVLACACMRAAS